MSRRIGIGFTVARRLATDGVDVLATGWTPHDAGQRWGADDADIAAALTEGLPDGSGTITYRQDDLADPDVPARVIDAAPSADSLIAVHARSSDVSLADSTAAELDLCWAVNVRATLLLVQRFAETERPRRVVMFTSGQHYGAMPGELPYVATKGALQQLTASLAAELAPRRITVNCINPGPVDTGYADDRSREWVAGRMPFGRWGRPDDTAELVSWLVSDASGWITGQTLVSDGGWGVRG